MEQIVKPELEHIAPKQPKNGTPIAAGYCEYDEDFVNGYLDCLGNYLLISKSHNCSIKNVPFKDKRASYTILAQQREIKEMTEDAAIWNKTIINKRYEKIVKFVVEEI